MNHITWHKHRVPVINTLRTKRNCRHFADDIFKCIFLNENVWISLKISLKFVPKILINNISALVQIMSWRRPGCKPFSEPMMVSLLTHICVTRPQWVKPCLWLVGSFSHTDCTSWCVYFTTWGGDFSPTGTENVIWFIDSLCFTSKACTSYVILKVCEYKQIPTAGSLSGINWTQ